MKKLINKIKEYSSSVIAFIIILAVALFITWLPTCGLVKLITLCFAIKFSWKFATGIWLILLLFYIVLSAGNGGKK